jgi:hypothetical protein
MNFTSERVVRPCDVEAALASSRYALYRIFKTSRSARESASVPSPNGDAAFVLLIRWISRVNSLDQPLFQLLQTLLKIRT